MGPGWGGVEWGGVPRIQYSLSQDLQMTEKYCNDRGIPFPRIKVHPKDLEEPQECYLFADRENPCSPIVLHFPLVNRTFRTHLSPGKDNPCLTLCVPGWTPASQN